MSKSLFNKSLMAIAALDSLPPLVRNTLLEDQEFRKEYDLITDAEISYNNINTSFQCSVLYKAVRDCLSESLEKSIVDYKGEIWEVKNINKEGELPQVNLSNGKQKISLSNLCVLSPNKNIRLSCLDTIVNDVNLPITEHNYWRDILSERTLTDEEIHLFQSDINNTPVQYMRLVKNSLASDSFDISSLVPNSRKYFERLVGTFDGSVSIREYATGQARAFFKKLSQWRHYDGLLFSLFLSSHSALTAEISVNHISSEDFLSVLKDLEERGDRISQIGAIEIGLQILKLRPEIEPILSRLIQQIAAECSENESTFKLMYALFVLVDGELSRIQMFKSEPPFFRRLVSLSQSALLCGQVVDSNIDIDSFNKWCINIRGRQFYLQSLVDLRLEPRWYPDFAEASQLRADFLGRIMNRVRESKQDINPRLSELIFGSDSRSINSQTTFPNSYFPGPLEGAIENIDTLPIEISSVIETQLSGEDVTPASFATLVNSALIFTIDAKYAEIAAKTIKFSNYQLKKLEDSSQLLGILNGLATVSAITRSNTLAEELRILARKYMNDSNYALSIDDVIRICLISAASYTDIGEWSKFVGNWLTELAFSNLEGDDGEILHSIIHALCQIVPHLWITCGRADAALKALNHSNF